MQKPSLARAWPVRDPWQCGWIFSEGLSVNRTGNADRIDPQGWPIGK